MASVTQNSGDSAGTEGRGWRRLTHRRGEGKTTSVFVIKAYEEALLGGGESWHLAPWLGCTVLLIHRILPCVPIGSGAKGLGGLGCLAQGMDKGHNSLKPQEKVPGCLEKEFLVWIGGEAMPLGYSLILRPWFWGR